MVNMQFIASTTRNKMPPKRRLGIGWESLKLWPRYWCPSYHVPLGIHSGFHLEPSRFSIVQCHRRHLRTSRGDVNIICVDNLGFWGITHYLTDCQLLQQNDVMAINVPTTRLGLDHVIRHFRSTASSKNRRRKNIRILEKNSFTRQNFPDSNVYGFKVPTLVSGFKISGDTTEPRSFCFGFV